MVAIPHIKKIDVPLRNILADGDIHTLSKIHDALSEHFGLTDEEKNQLTASGNKKFRTRIITSLYNLRQGGLVENPNRGEYKLTASGLSQSHSPSKVPKFSLTPETGQAQSLDLDEPEEAIEHHIDCIKRATKQDLLQQIHKCSDAEFETLVVKVLLGMKYGDSKDAGRRIGRSHDGGVDGVIKEDVLGLGKIYIQAKRWSEAKVGSTDIQKFLGALDNAHATKGVFITTSCFTKEAKTACDSPNKSITLINGDKLVEYMFHYGIGVREANTYTTKKIDPDFFDNL